MKKVLIGVLVLLLLSFAGCEKIQDGEVYHEDTVEEFAEAAGVSVEFAQSLNDAVGEIQEQFGRSFDISDVYSFCPTNDWAGGKRYTFSLVHEYTLIAYEQDGVVVSIRTSNGSFVYGEQ